MTPDERQLLLANSEALTLLLKRAYQSLGEYESGRELATLRTGLEQFNSKACYK